jgi:hypothetical protein
MAVRTFLSGWTLTLGSLSAVAALSASGVLATSSESVLRTSFSTALETAASDQQIAKSAPVAGTEEYWLTADKADGSLAATKTVSVGDRIDLTLGGQDRQLEVAEVSDYAPKAAGSSIGAAGRLGQNRFVLVTARETGNKDARSIRFVMEIEQKPVTAVGGQARAL